MLYARIVDGIVFETYAPPNGHDISACLHADLAAQCVLVPDGASPVCGWSYSGGAFAPPPPPTLAQQAAAMLAAGCQIVSTGMPAINGTYACDAGSRATIAEVVAGINAGDGFPGGGASFVYPLPGGVTFPSTVVFMAFAKAMRDFIYACATIAATGEGTLPTLPVTIA